MGEEVGGCRVDGEGRRGMVSLCLLLLVVFGSTRIVSWIFFIYFHRTQDLNPSQDGKRRLTLPRIARHLPHLEALDLSHLPPNTTFTTNLNNDTTYLGALFDLSETPPLFPDKFLSYFTYLSSNPDLHAQEEAAFLDFANHVEDYAYRRAQPTNHFRPHEWYFARQKTRTETREESFEEFFWRLCDAQSEYEAANGLKGNNALEELKQDVAASHLWRRLKWLGVPDWRSSSSAAKLVGSLVPAWAVSLSTVAIRGEYTRDLGADEVGSVHHHVCRFILGIERIVPPSVTTLELRLSVPFLRYFLEQIAKRRPGIKRVGIDLGAWVQVFPLRKVPDELRDEDVRRVARRLARAEAKSAFFQEGDFDWTYRRWEERVKGTREYEREREWVGKVGSWYRNRSGCFVEDEGAMSKAKQDGREESEKTDGGEDREYEFFDDLLKDRIGDDNTCPLDDSEHHAHTVDELDATRADTLSKMLGKLYLARREARQGPELFGLEGEVAQRSFDPIHPLTLTQVESLTGVGSGKDYDTWTPDKLEEVYPWLEKTFQWRPIFDWDWFMVPQDMALTADPSLVPSDDLPRWEYRSQIAEGPSRRGQAFYYALIEIKEQFNFLNNAGIPVHLLIGRRDPNLSNCYWGWPYTPDSWKAWLQDDFSTNLETIAEHIDTLSILYDLRNPLDPDRLSFIDARRPHHPPRGHCPTRVCPFTPKLCPFVKKYPNARKHHPRPQVKHLHRLRRSSAKPGVLYYPDYSGLAASSTTTPPAGDHADAHALYDDDNAEESHPPHQFARRSVFAREALAWHRFWAVYAPAFTRLSALRVRMPAAMDAIGSWPLWRLLDLSSGWSMVSFTDERAFLQTEEDLQRDFSREISPTPASVYAHKKEERVWPSGRFVRRSWVWDPLRKVERVAKAKRVAGEAGDSITGQGSREEAVVGNKYLEYAFVPRARPTPSFTDAKTLAGDASCLAFALADLARHVGREVEDGDPTGEDGTPLRPRGTRIAQPAMLWYEAIPGHEGVFRTLQGQRVRNIAGGMWREELRAMKAFAESTLEKMEERGGELREGLERDAERIAALLGRNPPYARMVEVSGGRIGLRSVGETWEGGSDEGVDGDGGSTDDDGDDDEGGGSSPLPAPSAQQPNDKDDGETLAPPEPYDPTRPSIGFPSASPNLPANSGSGTDEDSLFADSEVEVVPPVTPPPRRPTPSPFTSPEQGGSSERKEGAKKVNKGGKDGPFVESDDEDDDNDAKPEGAKIGVETKEADAEQATTENIATYEGAVRTPQTPVDEDYTDDDAPDKPVEDVVVPVAEKTPEADERADTQPPGDEGEGMMSFMQWLTQASRANGFLAASTGPAGKKRKAGGDVGKGKPPGKKVKIAEEPASESQPAPELESELEPGSEPEPSADPAPEAEQTAPPPSPPLPPSTRGKRKRAPSPSAPSKKNKPRGGRRAKTYHESSSSTDADEADDDDADAAPKPKRTRSQADYIPSPSPPSAPDTNPASHPASSSSEDDAPKPARKKTGKKKGNTTATATAAPAPAPATTTSATPSITVPSKTDGSGAPDYAKLTVKNLRALAKERGVGLRGAALKGEIVRRFEEDDEGRGGGGGGGGGGGVMT